MARNLRAQRRAKPTPSSLKASISLRQYFPITFMVFPLNPPGVARDFLQQVSDHFGLHDGVSGAIYHALNSKSHFPS